MWKHILIPISLVHLLAGIILAQVQIAPHSPPKPFDSERHLTVPRPSQLVTGIAHPKSWGWGHDWPSPWPIEANALPAEAVVDRRFPFGPARDYGPVRWLRKR